MMKSAAELLKEEFMTRYGLSEDQIDIEINITNVTKDLSHQIVSDFNTNPYASIDGDNVDSTFLDGPIGRIWAHHNTKRKAEGNEEIELGSF